MLENQVELRENIGKAFERYKQLMPEIAAAYDELPMETYKDGELSGKHKRLQALAAALVAGCRACILFQLGLALELGATRDEVLETCAVAISLGGTMAAGQTSRVIQYMEEMGFLD